MLAEIAARIGPTDLLACAGVSGALVLSGPHVMLINFIGACHLVELVVESMMPEGSSIVFISSIGGLGWEKVLPWPCALEFLDTPDER